MGSQCSIGPICSSLGFIYHLLCLADDMVGAGCTQPEIIMTGAQQGIMFMEYHFGGMVGESIEVYQAYQVTFSIMQPPKVRKEPLTYDELKVVYRTIEGKERRLRFWYNMVSHSPEAEQRRFREQEADAISRVI